MIESQVEFVLFARDALLSFATGTTTPEVADYAEFRQTLLKDPAFGSDAPEFLRPCRTLSDFWDFIKTKGPYAARRQYLREQFEPLLTRLEGGAPKASRKDAERAQAVTGKDETDDNRRIFVVHGRNELARDAMFQFLRSIGLDPIEWSEVVRATGTTNPYVGDVVETGLRLAHAVVVLLTGDDEARLLSQFVTSRDQREDVGPTRQARPNVLFEAGMAVALSRDRTVLVSLGQLRPLSDLSGVHIVRMDDTTERRQDLAERLQAAGCPVKLTGRDWHKVGQFNAAAAFSELPAPRTALAADMDRQAVSDRWREVLNRMTRTIRAAYLDAEPSFDGSTLILAFHYGFHLKKAQDQAAAAEKLIAEAFGPGTKLVMQLGERGPSTIVQSTT
jgi:predicted nucleotide-binding protein